MADSFVVTSTETLSPANINTWIAKVHFRFWTTHSPIKSRWFVRIAVVVAGVFMVATGLLSYQVSQSIKQLDAVIEELGSAQQTIDGLKQKDPICNTKECVVSAAALMEAMDPSVDPCQDFYQFTCGGWLRKNSIPETSSRWGHFNILREQVTHLLKEVLTEPNAMRDSKPVNNSRDMYMACMDTDAIEILGLTPLTEILDSYGRWPMTVSNWTADQFDWRSVSLSIRKNFGESFLFEVYNYLDWKDINVLVGSIRTGTSVLDSDQRQVKLNSCCDESVCQLRFRNSQGGKGHDSRRIKIVSQIQTKPEMRRNRTRMYNPMRLDALQRWTNVVHLTRSTNFKPGKYGQASIQKCFIHPLKS